MSAKMPPVNNLGRTLGYVRHYNTTRGFGFVTMNKNFNGPKEDDFFFHADQCKLKASIVERKMVEFRPVQTEKGIQAWDIIIIDYLDQNIQ